MSSITNAKDDIQLRSLIEATTEGQTQIELTENFLQKHKQYITEEEIMATEIAILNIQNAIQMKDKNAIIKANEELNTISSPYAERVMDIAVAEAMKGQRI